MLLCIVFWIIFGSFRFCVSNCYLICVLIVVYKSPEYETLGFDLIRDAIVTFGYPDAIKEFKYDPTFPVRSEQSRIFCKPQRELKQEVLGIPWCI